jgi:hypothetical protein
MAGGVFFCPMRFTRYSYREVLRNKYRLEILPDEVCSVNTTILFYTADILQDTSLFKEINPKNYTQTAHFYSHTLTF